MPHNPTPATAGDTNSARDGLLDEYGRAEAGTAPWTLTELMERLAAYRSEVIADRDAQIIAWLEKKAREEGTSNKDSRVRATAIYRMADKLPRGAVRPPLSGEVQRLRDRVAKPEAQAEKVTAFCAQRAEYVSNLREFVEGGEHDYYRWTGHAEARRQLSQSLGLPVAWPAGDKPAPAPAEDEDSHEKKVAEYLSTPYTDDFSQTPAATIESAVRFPDGSMWLMPAGWRRDQAISSGATLVTRTVTDWTEVTA